MSTARTLAILFIAFTVRADVTATLDDYFTRAAAHGFSGSVLVARGDEILLRKGYGLADRRARIAATPRTAYNIASLDKQFIAAAILKLEESGKLATTDTLARFFDFAPDDKKNITLHQLLSHTSGLPNDYWDEHAELSREQFVRFVLAQPLESRPGTEWSYSNSAFIVLERIIELASGVAYERYLHDALFAPAGMAYTGFAIPKLKPHQVAHYDFWTVDTKSLPGDVAFDDPLQRPPARRVLLSSVDDLRAWHQQLPSLLGRASLAKLYTPVMSDYAYGWNVVRTTRGTRLIHHGGSDTNTGMLVTYRNYADENVFFVIATNSMQPSLVSDYMAADVEAMLFGGAVTFPPAARPNRDALAGKYGAYDVVAVDGGPLVLRTEDRTAMLELRFPSAPAAQDDAANDLVRAAFAGDSATVQRATHAGDAFMQTVREGIAQWKQAYGNVTNIRTVGQRTFVFEAEPEIQSYVRVDFERGAEILRVIHTGAGLLRLDRLKMPPFLEMVLAPAGPGKWTTWDFKLGTGAIVSRDGSRLVLQGQ
ncbi:MAG: beta-lactamase family protein [Acidobacteria bacterium]|nr:beta-lactamase family protein [Acidobacteriota bacterium]MBV9478479.1 beta-lactamase family protein [Acidobacteriota bacterium]